jgi:hypothetical protein
MNIRMVDQTFIKKSDKDMGVAIFVKKNPQLIK